MGDWIIRANSRVRPLILLSCYWSVFWVLNGLDKFLNGTMQPMMSTGLAKGVLVAENGDIQSTLYGMEISGWFGVNRNAKTVAFFERLGMPEPVALTSLYIVALAEIVLGCMFLIGLRPKPHDHGQQKALTALAYKLSMGLFMVFCVVDILIGERIELWEHSTFLLVLMISYLWLAVGDKVPAIMRALAADEVRSRSTR